jgi:hypothetical protein
MAWLASDVQAEIDSDITGEATQGGLWEKHRLTLATPFWHTVAFTVFLPGVGKSCLLLRFCDDAWTPSFITCVIWLCPGRNMGQTTADLVTQSIRCTYLP